MPDIDHFVYDETSNFTEEILLENEGSLFDIVVRYSECEGDDNFVKNTNISKACYYFKFIEKLLGLKASKRKKFVQYQMNLRINPKLFLTEFHDFIQDYGDYLDPLKDEYLNIINEFQVGNLTQHEIKDENPELDIFISHSSNDKIIVEKFLNLIQNAFKLSENKIRCTSVPGFKLKSGDNVDLTLLKEIQNAKVFLGFISKQSLESTYVLFEIGARWGTGHNPWLIAINDSVFVNLPKPISNFHNTSLAQRTGILQVLKEIQETLQYQSYNPVRIDSFIEDLISSCENMPNEVNTKSIPQLQFSETERELLKYATSSLDGTFRVIHTQDGTTLQIDQKIIVDSDMHREYAPYLEALDKLFEKGYLKKEEHEKNLRYMFTTKAYNQ
jgi:hypothetical protein